MQALIAAVVVFVLAMAWISWTPPGLGAIAAFALVLAHEWAFGSSR